MTTSRGQCGTISLIGKKLAIRDVGFIKHIVPERAILLKRVMENAGRVTNLPHVAVAILVILDDSVCASWQCFG